MRLGYYSPLVIAEVKSAPQQYLGVQLALLCIAKEVPVAYVSKELGISRATTYSWFKGKTIVPRKHEVQVLNLIKQIKLS